MLKWFKMINERSEKMNNETEILSKNFAKCRNLLTAIGDETRQHLIIEMIKIGDCNGIRVGNITEKTNLSRPAVSHHLQIMKKAGLVKVRKEGTKNFYYFDPDVKELDRLISVLQSAKEITKNLPDRSGEND